MKKYVIVAILLGLLLPRASGAERKFRIRRVKVVANPCPEEIAGDEVLEVKFEIPTPGWVSPAGWCLKTFVGDKKPKTTLHTACFLRSETPVHRLRENRLKGNSSFTAYFPLPAGSSFFLVALGNPFELEVTLLPSTALIEEFRVSRGEVLREIGRSDYRIVEDE
jgi:hypothetical protein